MSKYVIFRSKKTKEFYFHLVASNGKVVGMEGYKRKAGAMKAIRALKNSGSAPIIIEK